MVTRNSGGRCQPPLGQCLRAALVVHAAYAVFAYTSAAVANEEPNALEEVVVTAQKRVENLQDVPVSVQVISGQSLVQQNYNSLEELTKTVPAVHISTGGQANSIFIRGIGSDQNPAFEQSVAMFTDDIYHGRSRMSNAAFIDLERIEVLKGPQSTFFGNNAIAGALNIVTRKPTKELEASIRALYGQFGQYALEGVISGPVTDRFAARLAVTGNGGRGWIRNVNTGDLAPVENNLGARLTLAYNPTENLDAIFKVEASRSGTSGTGGDQPAQFTNCPPPAPYTPSFAGSCAVALALNDPIGLDHNFNSGLANQRHHLSTFEDVLTVNYRGWGQTFTSVTGFYHYNYSSNVDAANTGTYYSTAQNPESYHQFSEELRVASPADQRIEYMFGAYMQTDKLDNGAEINLPFLDFLAGPFPILAPYLPVAAAATFRQDERIYAIFGSTSWHVTDRVKLNAGLRATWDIKTTDGNFIYGHASDVFGGLIPNPPEITAFQVPLFNQSAGPTPPAHRDDHAVLPSAGLQYQFDPEVMIYVRYERGFKGGGANAAGNALLPVEDEVFAPEYANAYEIGLKGKGFDDRALLNLSVFRTDYKGLQVNAGIYNPVSNATNTFIKNAANSRSQGIELEGQLALSTDFRLGANVTYLESYYVSYPNASRTTLQQYCAGDYVLPYCAQFPNPVPPIFNASGNSTPYAPKWSGSIVASYGFLLPRGLKFTTTVSPYFTSHFYTGTNGPADPLYQVGSYVRLDSRLSLETAGGHWALDLIGKNLTDRVIPTSIGTTPYFTTVTKEQPRNVAVQFRYRW